MLEREECREAEPRICREQIDVVATAGIDTRDIRDQSEALATRPLWRVGNELIEPWSNDDTRGDDIRRCWRRQPTTGSCDERGHDDMVHDPFGWAHAAKVRTNPVATQARSTDRHRGTAIMSIQRKGRTVHLPRDSSTLR